MDDFWFVVHYEEHQRRPSRLHRFHGRVVDMPGTTGVYSYLMSDLYVFVLPVHHWHCSTKVTTTEVVKGLCVSVANKCSDLI
jgi:hypothetical protein